MSNKYENYDRPNFQVDIESKLLPLGSANRTGKKQVPKYIVIHEVSLGLGRTPEKYDMDYYANLIETQGKKGKSIGYHFLVGDKKIYQFVKENESTDHTGTFEGNRSSIGIERLVCNGINYEYALHNQAKLIATLMLKWNISLENVKTHKGMICTFDPGRENKKNCPSRMLAGQRGGEKKFRREIVKCFRHRWFFYELLDEKKLLAINNLSNDEYLMSNYCVGSGYSRKKIRH